MHAAVGSGDGILKKKRLKSILCSAVVSSTGPFPQWAGAEKFTKGFSTFSLVSDTVGRTVHGRCKRYRKLAMPFFFFLLLCFLNLALLNWVNPARN